MCFILEEKDIAADGKAVEPKVARRDIKVYKVLDTNAKSMFYMFDYSKHLNKETPHVTLSPRSNNVVYEGYHSYDLRTTWIEFNDNTDHLGYDGLFSIRRSSDDVMVSSFDDSKIMEAVIPRGTKYYHSAIDGEYVSETVVPIEIVDCKATSSDRDKANISAKHCKIHSSLLGLMIQKIAKHWTKSR